MLRYFYILLISIVSAALYAQNNTNNYITETVYRDGKNASDNFTIITNTNKVSTTYYDGLGRPIQVLLQNASAIDDQNIVTHIEYEKNIGQIKEYLPFVSAGKDELIKNGVPSGILYHSKFVNDAKVNTLAYYDTDKYGFTKNPYSENKLEASPRKRPLETGFPGFNWSLSMHANEDSRNTIRSQYKLNEDNEVIRFRVDPYFEDVYKYSLTDNGYYPANTLYKTIIKNENWKTGDGRRNTTEEFKDSRGLVLLKRAYMSADTYNTYYIYDERDLLIAVLPPLLDGFVADEDALNLLAYQYRYDERNRLVEKKLPQKDWEYIVYDASDRVVMTGPVMTPFRDNGVGWLLTRYDVFGRVAYTGFIRYTHFDSQERNSMRQQNFEAVHRVQQPVNINGVNIYYNTVNLPSDFVLLTVNYYDDYDFGQTPNHPPILTNGVVNPQVKGLQTGSWSRITSNDVTQPIDADVSFIYYDHKYQPVLTHTNNYLGGFTSIENELTFNGTLTKSRTKHQRTNQDPIIELVDEYVYDIQENRMLQHFQTFNNGSQESIVKNEYDALGALVRKEVGGTPNGGGLQKVDYKYNIRGWLTDINNADYNHVDYENDLFDFKINYDLTTGYLSNKPLFNGNINSVFSRNKLTNEIKGYAYSYDELNRLTLAKNVSYKGGWYMGHHEDNSYNEEVYYDRNGNIQRLNRTGYLLDADQAIDMDELIYSYNGNQVTNIVDISNSPEGYKNNTEGNEYFYDNFGNLIRDKNKKISRIVYNHLNLPTRIDFMNGERIEYRYDAQGNKKEKTVMLMGVAEQTNYFDGFQYLDGVLEFVQTPEGYIGKEKYIGNEENLDGDDAYHYHYIHRDHLGNSRVIYSDYDKDNEINNNIVNATGRFEVLEALNYYPFGLRQIEPHLPQAPTKYKYRFGGKELQEEGDMNVYDFGARNYDPTIGRWMNVDPKAEEMRRFSPYVYAFNNPIYFIDPDGMKPDDWYIDWGSGKVLGQDGAKTNNVRIIKGQSWAQIKNSEGGTVSQSATNKLQAEGNIITINSNKIHSDINKINTATINDPTKERQAFFMINRSEDGEGRALGELTTVIGPEGGKNGATIPATKGYENNMFMVGQIHSHDLAPEGYINTPGTSVEDYNSSELRNFNIYSIDSYQGQQEGGNGIYMTNPNTPPLPGLPTGTTLDTSALGSQVLDDYIKLNK